ncbi:MAG: M42 family metallopeptidase, partial [Candidatus Sumerlaeota bacterium]
PGLIASKPPHLMSDEEKKKMVSQKDMFIDICCSNADEARAMGVRVGDAVVADSTFSLIEKARYKDGKKSGKATLAMGKAFDNRAGLFIAVEVLRTLAKKEIDHPNTVVAGATTMEELGLRGATTSGYMVEPDVCMALDVGIAGDVPGIEKHQSNTALGSGVSITTYDSGMIPNQALKELVIETAEKENIPHVLTSLGRGTTDAAAVHKTKTGCPSIYLGIPTRHIHSHAGIIDLHDIQACIDLVVAVVQRLDKKTVQSLTEI